MTDFVNQNKTEMLSLLKELSYLPAPSGFEEKRAHFCKTWLEDHGANGVYIDDELNVVYPYCCDNNDKLTVFSAHTDTVFPNTDPLPYSEDDTTISFPGVGDNTASVVVLLIMAKYFTEKKVPVKNGILFVFNSCEEGLGNLKGTRKIFSDYKNRIKQFISFDSTLDTVHDRCVGSHRYCVEVKTKGGHSYYNFGEYNAISLLSSVVNDIYKIKVPEKSDTKTTYNVGTISGGTSVNTIAQSAEMLCEYRSDDIECLSYMQSRFEEVFENAKTRGLDISVDKVGDRPCADIDPSEIRNLKDKVIPIVENLTAKKVCFTSASTDCNIPLSLGVPALCIGVSMYEGMHTRQECLFKDSLEKGLAIAIQLGLKLSE